jgi:epoxyqueuosine reductase
MADSPWSELRTRAAQRGLNILWAVPRDEIEPLFTPAHDALTPAALHPRYRHALVLASAGAAFWRAFRAAQPQARDPAGDPLDRYTAQVVETLCAELRAADPSALALYPFRHERTLPGFRRLLGRRAAAAPPAPFGVALDARAGPWWALRGALLTALEGPADAPLGENPCVTCPAPCVTACPAGAVSRRGFDWEACGEFRLGGPTCRETCLARLACPVGPAYRYDADAIAFHYRGSLRELEKLRTV